MNIQHPTGVNDVKENADFKRLPMWPIKKKLYLDQIATGTFSNVGDHKTTTRGPTTVSGSYKSPT